MARSLATIVAPAVLGTCPDFFLVFRVAMAQHVAAASIGVSLLLLVFDFELIGVARRDVAGVDVRFGSSLRMGGQLFFLCVVYSDSGSDCDPGSVWGGDCVCWAGYGCALVEEELFVSSFIVLVCGNVSDASSVCGCHACRGG
uniref:Uncharacterized protein n=1 Tax=Anopheles darlingi TaxID=43151 RepID=A0A2M4DRQ4_ANODA